MAKLLKDFGAAKNVPMFNLEIYQDGTMSPATIAMFQEARRETAQRVRECLTGLSVRV